MVECRTTIAAVVSLNVLDLIEYRQIRYSECSDDEIVDRSLTGHRLPSGQYAFALSRGRSVYLARDPIGCNKLFFGHNSEGRLVVGSRVARVWRHGVALAEISSCPPGHVLEVSNNAVRDRGGSDMSNVPASASLCIAEFAEQSRAILDQAFAWLASAFKGCRFVICLSGGLDSSIIAAFAALHLPDAVAASFTYLSADDLRRALSGPAAALLTVSDDFRCAANVATALGLPLLPVLRAREAVAGAIGLSVRLCQDWRDFNVHCAVVNLFLAQEIRAAFPGETVVVLTGDLMNEYVCDYREEKVGDTIYYKIPRISIDKCRKYFVRGLDAGDREIGVFSAYGLVCSQPFAALAEHYMRIPGSMLELPELKSQLNAPLLPEAVRPHVNRVKTRAQVGGSDLGTLGIFHQLGIGELQLRQEWRAQFPGESTQSCDELIQFGRYKTPTYSPVAQ
jgi:asparagine synthetase B (glutamine-hydrolysing)